VWDVTTGRHVLTLKGHGGPVRGVAFRPDGERLATAGGDKTAKLWDVKTGREVLTLAGHAAGVHVVAFSPDGWRLASGSSAGHPGLPPPQGIPPDGWRLAAARAAGTVKIWDATPVDGPGGNPPPKEEGAAR
jgi:WD40 repeat protein